MYILISFYTLFCFSLSMVKSRIDFHRRIYILDQNNSTFPQNNHSYTYTCSTHVDVQNQEKMNAHNWEYQQQLSPSCMLISFHFLYLRVTGAISTCTNVDITAMTMWIMQYWSNLILYMSTIKLSQVFPWEDIHIIVDFGDYTYKIYIAYQWTNKSTTKHCLGYDLVTTILAVFQISLTACEVWEIALSFPQVWIRMR